MNTEKQPAGAGPFERRVRQLVWTEPAGPMPGCLYDHTTAETPFGRFLITWKSWKQHDCPGVDETPWGDFFGSWSTAEQAQKACEAEFEKRLLEALTPNV